jgi:hypothetical protein
MTEQFDTRPEPACVIRRHVWRDKYSTVYLEIRTYKAWVEATEVMDLIKTYIPDLSLDLEFQYRDWQLRDYDAEEKFKNDKKLKGKKLYRTLRGLVITANWTDPWTDEEIAGMRAAAIYQIAEIEERIAIEQERIDKIQQTLV